MELNIDWFSDKESMEAFEYAVQVANKLKEKGITLFDQYGNVYDCSKVRIEINGKDSAVSIDSVWLIGCTHELPENGGQLYGRKTLVDEFFEDLKVATEFNIKEFIQ